MARTVGIGIQDFATIIESDYFYIDKTNFIKEWWERGNAVTLITRPRRFGKTLTVNMTEQFFSIANRGRGGLFSRLYIWREDDAILLEFKVQDPEDEKELSDTVEAALKQIEQKNYASALLAKGIPKNRIRTYGFVFCGNFLCAFATFLQIHPYL